jgi:hypothetical protein
VSQRFLDDFAKLNRFDIVKEIALGNVVNAAVRHDVPIVVAFTDSAASARQSGSQDYRPETRTRPAHP